MSNFLDEYLQESQSLAPSDLSALEHRSASVPAEPSVEFGYSAPAVQSSRRGPRVVSRVSKPAMSGVPRLRTTSVGGQRRSARRAKAPVGDALAESSGHPSAITIPDDHQKSPAYRVLPAQEGSGEDSGSDSGSESSYSYEGQEDDLTLDNGPPHNPPATSPPTPTFSTISALAPGSLAEALALQDSLPLLAAAYQHAQHATQEPSPNSPGLAAPPAMYLAPAVTVDSSGVGAGLGAPAPADGYGFFPALASGAGTGYRLETAPTSAHRRGSFLAPDEGRTVTPPTTTVSTVSRASFSSTSTAPLAHPTPADSARSGSPPSTYPAESPSIVAAAETLASVAQAQSGVAAGYFAPTSAVALAQAQLHGRGTAYFPALGLSAQQSHQLPPSAPLPPKDHRSASRGSVKRESVEEWQGSEASGAAVDSPAKAGHSSAAGLPPSHAPGRASAGRAKRAASRTPPPVGLASRAPAPGSASAGTTKRRRTSSRVQARETAQEASLEYDEDEDEDEDGDGQRRRSLDSPAGNRPGSASASGEPDLAGLDPAALRRIKNTMAARRSRERKLARLSGLEAQVKELQTTNAQLSARCDAMEDERRSWQEERRTYEGRVVRLESLLREAHSELYRLRTGGTSAAGMPVAATTSSGGLSQFSALDLAAWQTLAGSGRGGGTEGEGGRDGHGGR